MDEFPFLASSHFPPSCLFPRRESVTEKDGEGDNEWQMKRKGVGWERRRVGEQRDKLDAK